MWTDVFDSVVCRTRTVLRRTVCLAGIVLENCPGVRMVVYDHIISQKQGKLRCSPTARTWSEAGVTDNTCYADRRDREYSRNLNKNNSVHMLSMIYVLFCCTEGFCCWDGAGCFWVLLILEHKMWHEYDIPVWINETCPKRCLLPFVLLFRISIIMIDYNNFTWSVESNFVWVKVSQYIPQQ